MSAFHDKIFASFIGSYEYYKGLPKAEQAKIKKEWLQKYQSTFTDLANKAKGIIKGLEAKTMSYKTARSEFSHYIHRSHPYMYGVLIAIPMLDEACKTGDRTDKGFLQAMKLIAQL